VNLLPGPMFNIAAFLGGVMSGTYLGCFLAWFALFLPGLLLQFAALPYWASLHRIARVRRFLTGASASAAGLMASAVFILWSKVVTDLHRASFTVALFGLKQIVDIPAYGLILIGAASSGVFYLYDIPF